MTGNSNEKVLYAPLYVLINCVAVHMIKQILECQDLRNANGNYNPLQSVLCGAQIAVSSKVFAEKYNNLVAIALIIFRNFNRDMTPNRPMSSLLLEMSAYMQD